MWFRLERSTETRKTMHVSSLSHSIATAKPLLPAVKKYAGLTYYADRDLYITAEYVVT